MIFGCSKCKKTYDGYEPLLDNKGHHICEICGESYAFPLDDNMILIVKHLWAKGYETLYGCSGHVADWYVFRGPHRIIERNGYIYCKGTLTREQSKKIRNSKHLSECDKMPPGDTFTIRWVLKHDDERSLLELYEIVKEIKEIF